MRAVQLKIDNKMQMTCRQLSDLTGVRHDSVKRTIASLESKGIIESPQIVEIQTRTNKRKDYVFKGEEGERDSIIVIAQVSPEATAKLVDEWRSLKIEVAQLRQSILERQAARLESPELTAALKNARAADGKDTQGHHYANEYNLINRLVLGMTARQYIAEHNLLPSAEIRDTMRPVEIQAIAELQRANTALIDMGIGYQERKTMLKALRDRKFKKALIDEILRIES